jgi:hypothetical protein
MIKTDLKSADPVAQLDNVNKTVEVVRGQNKEVPLLYLTPPPQL